MSAKTRKAPDTGSFAASSVTLKIKLQVGGGESSEQFLRPANSRCVKHESCKLNIDDAFWTIYQL